MGVTELFGWRPDRHPPSSADKWQLIVSSGAAVACASAAVPRPTVQRSPVRSATPSEAQAVKQIIDLLLIGNHIGLACRIDLRAIQQTLTGIVLALQRRMLNQ